MSKVYIIADLHFGHDNIAMHRGFKNAEEQDTLIIKNWNSVVGKNDIVWILGDIGMEKSTHYHLLNELKGKKKVILGNHDLPKHTPELLKYVEQVGAMVKYKGYILSHCPIHESEMEHYNVNIHGHVHEKTINDDRYLNVSCDVLNYTPMEFPKRIKASVHDKKQYKMKSERVKEYENKLKTHKVVKELMAVVNDNNWCDSVTLVGGAVVDILDGREPKDYDICILDSNIRQYGYREILKRLRDTDDFSLIYTSATAYTFNFKGYKVQILKTNPSDFMFEIEKSSFGLKSGKFQYFDIVGFESKMLIPNDELSKIKEHSFIVMKKRLKRWSQKGYKIHRITYKSTKRLLKRNNRILEVIRILLPSKRFQS